MSGPHHRTSRCVFVGNIPYDATEEQLVQICEEVGPVVSFRLVVDRDTGKPRGYGFCEFKDEETALSARRNLQGYEINGRQLRVDFAENEKGGGGADRNRDQGRGGPGFQQGASQADALKHGGLVGNPQLFGAAGVGTLEQPIVRGAAATAAQFTMVEALGGSQQMPNMMPAQGSLQSLTTPAALVSGNGGGAAGTDSLTNHLAGMSKSQLYEIMSQMKIMIQQNQQQARQILVSNPQLTKALFQAQIVLGMVRTQQMQPQAQTAVPAPAEPANLMTPQPRPLPQVPSSAQSQSQAPNKSNLQGPFSQAPQVEQSPQTSQPLLSQGSYQSPAGMVQISLGMPFQSGQPPPPNQPPPQQLYPTGSNLMPTRMSLVGANNSGGHGGQGSGVGTVHLQAPIPPGMSMASGHPMSTSTPGAALPSNGEHNLRSYPGMNQGLNLAMNSGRNSGFRASTKSGVGVGMNQGMNQGMGIPGMGIPGVGAFAGAVDGTAVISSALQPQSFSQLQMPVPQEPLELEQQKALLQQVMNLTTEQIMSLPPEQRQQVLQLQQALR